MLSDVPSHTAIRNSRPAGSITHSRARLEPTVRQSLLIGVPGNPQLHCFLLGGDLVARAGPLKVSDMKRPFHAAVARLQRNLAWIKNHFELKRHPLDRSRFQSHTQRYSCRFQRRPPGLNRPRASILRRDFRAGQCDRIPNGAAPPSPDD